MKINVGVFAKGQLSGELVKEAKNALQDVALKYNCRFELSRGEASEEKTKTMESNFSANLKKGTGDNKGVFLSFGGELELE